ncbi:MAG: hypothetical protein ACKKMV_01290 [Candidatus Nealsonbacteria bacterium]|nr:MAG: hypothetical protein IB617_00600 [Candidatus Nealsonbacteria bacterium]
MKSHKHSLKQDFFDKWSPEMAYVLGFWFADGYMRRSGSYKIVFYAKDYEMLTKIRNVMGSSHPFYRDKRYESFQFTVYSKRLFQKLLELGGIRCKSKTMKFPKVPFQYLPDFIRGYFDGDGSVFYTTYIHSKNKKLRRELRSNFTSGNKEFLESLQNIFINVLGFTKKKICPYDERASWKLGYGTKDTLSLLRFMYYPNYPIGLDRKSSFLKNR